MWVVVRGMVEGEGTYIHEIIPYDYNMDGYGYGLYGER